MMRKKMTRTDERYTYEDLLLRKRILKQEIREMEKMASLENLPKTLGIVGGGIKDKALDLIQNPNALSMLIDAGVGIGAEKVISRFINKKSLTGQAVVLASAYLIPFAIRQTKKLVVKLTSKKDQPAALDISDAQIIETESGKKEENDKIS